MGDDDAGARDVSPQALMALIAASLSCLHDVDEAAYRRTINLLMHQIEAELTPYTKAPCDQLGAVPQRLLLRRIE